jgi:hypothetical protein
MSIYSFSSLVNSSGDIIIPIHLKLNDYLLFRIFSRLPYKNAGL